MPNTYSTSTVSCDTICTKSALHYKYIVIAVPKIRVNRFRSYSVSLHSLIGSRTSTSRYWVCSYLCLALRDDVRDSRFSIRVYMLCSVYGYVETGYVGRIGLLRPQSRRRPRAIHFTCVCVTPLEILYSMWICFYHIFLLIWLPKNYKYFW